MGAGGTYVLVVAHYRQYNVVFVLLIVYMQIMYTLPATEKKINAALIKTVFLAFLGPQNKQLYLICCDIYLDCFPSPCCTTSHPCQKAPPKSLMSQISRPQRWGPVPAHHPNQGNPRQEQMEPALCTGLARLQQDLLLWIFGVWKKQCNWSSVAENRTFSPKF